MTLRRLPAVVPPVLLTALLVHVAANGFDHAPGLEGAPALGALLFVSLALAALTVFLGADARSGRGSIATKGSDAACLAALVAGGFGLYLALELLEGHGLAFGLPPLLAILPAALLVFRASRAAGTLLRAAGVAFAAYLRAARTGAPDGWATAPGRPPAGSSLVAGGRHPGRAPPLPI
jgi:hypothetical protein